jgi:iron complex transport system ATP-binding protein
LFLFFYGTGGAAMLELTDMVIKGGKTNLLKFPFSCRETTGQTIVFFGRNGAGKTTLLRTLAGHIPIHQGNVKAFGHNLSVSSTSQWAKICVYIGSREHINQSISTREFLLTARLGHTGGLGLYKKEDVDVTNHWITRLKLEPLLEKNYLFLSDGEKQLVTIARAFIYGSPLILLDEPTSSLDIPNKKVITELLHRLSAEENKLIIYTTHDYFTSLAYCKKVWFINNRNEFAAGDFSTMRSTIESDFGIHA